MTISTMTIRLQETGVRREIASFDQWAADNNFALRLRLEKLYKAAEHLAAAATLLENLP